MEAVIKIMLGCFMIGFALLMSMWGLILMDRVECQQRDPHPMVLSCEMVRSGKP